MDPSVKLVLDCENLILILRRSKRMIGKLNYLTMTCPEIVFVMSVISQFLEPSCQTHWVIVVRILKYIKKTTKK